MLSRCAPTAMRMSRIAPARMMTIKVGDTIPDVSIQTGFPPEPVVMKERLAGKNVIVVGLPGAFTPTCSGQQVPGYLAAQDALKAKGIDEVVVVCINDGAVMNAWADDQGVGRDGVGTPINFLADPHGALVDAMGMRMNHEGPQHKFGQGRSKRYGAFFQDGVLKVLNVSEAEDDPAGDANPSSSLVENMLADMEKL
eukprot:TRINITY_DN16585_c0_g1_i4.p2 TRINITY_DN16585_c0_g1~~TRINITY_DN16585_c0_g1_i4.p2  ORF type:complete len:197 (+),score=44.56 TRINITY_DN16585_c0_g1_i4:177-767(+)